MKETLNTLRQHHQHILFLIEKPERLQELIHFVEDVHHPMEENLLFPYIKDRPFLNQGGPRCSHFMGIRLELDPLSQVRLHIQEFIKDSKFKIEPYKALPWLTPQSPLSIPFEEHAIGAELGQCLHYLFELKGEDIYLRHFSKLYSDYIKLLKMHIDKEDNCLFIMCERNLG